MASSPVTWRKLLLRALVFLVVSYGVVLIVMMLMQRWLMYPADKTGPLPVSQVSIEGMTGRDVSVRTTDGILLHGWSFTHKEPAPDGTRPTILFLHGNGGHRGYRVHTLALLARLGANVLIFDYRGYAENAGSPSEEGLTSDAAAMWSFATESLDIPPEQIVLFGESLGGALAVKLAARHSQEGTVPGGLIVRSSFNSMVAAAGVHYPWLPVSWLIYDRYESAEIIDEVRSPILALHGNEDRVVPLELGRKLFHAAPEASAEGIEKTFVVLEGAGHNDVRFVAGEQMQEAIGRFLEMISGNGDTRQEGAVSEESTADLSD